MRLSSSKSAKGNGQVDHLWGLRTSCGSWWLRPGLSNTLINRRNGHLFRPSLTSWRKALTVGRRPSIQWSQNNGRKVVSTVCPSSRQCVFLTSLLRRQILDHVAQRSLVSDPYNSIKRLNTDMRNTTSASLLALSQQRSRGGRSTWPDFCKDCEQV